MEGIVVEGISNLSTLLTCGWWYHYHALHRNPALKQNHLYYSGLSMHNILELVHYQGFAKGAHQQNCIPPQPNDLQEFEHHIPIKSLTCNSRSPRNAGSRKQTRQPFHNHGIITRQSGTLSQVTPIHL